MSGLATSRRYGLLALLLLVGAVACAGRALAANLEDFYGAYVGQARVEELAAGTASARDIDIVIEPFHDDGFQINWITVVKVDGRRDVPGVRRMVQSAFFAPAEGKNFYVEVEADNPFEERAEMQAMSGKAVRWANLDDEALHVYSFVVLEDGRYEFQIYDRILTDIGLDIAFQRFDDGVLVRRIKGKTVRAEP